MQTISTITVYQAYGPQIGCAAGESGRFPAAFKRDRMMWIPSFLWMMYWSGWATKPGQEHVLAIELQRDGFEWAVSHSSERDLHLRELPYRSLQIGQGHGPARRGPRLPAAAK